MFFAIYSLCGITCHGLNQNRKSISLTGSDDTIDVFQLSTLVMRILFTILVLGCILITASSCSNSQQPIAIEQAWIREAPPNASAMAGYMRIINNSDQDNTLVSAASDSFKVIEFHRSVEKEGVYRMIRHESLTVPAKGMLELKPGDYHLMLIKPKIALVEGDNVSVQLMFSDQSNLSIELPVKKASYE